MSVSRAWGPWGIKQGGSIKNPSERPSWDEKLVTHTTIREIFQKTEETFITPILKYRHKSLKGSTILFSVTGKFQLLLKNKTKEI